MATASAAAIAIFMSVDQPHLNIVTDDPGLVMRDADTRILDQRAGADVELPSVPWARDDAVANDAIGQRPAAMEAHIVDRVERAADVEERDPALVDGHLARLARRELVHSGHGDEVRHQKWSLGLGAWCLVRAGSWSVVQNRCPWYLGLSA